MLVNGMKAPIIGRVCMDQTMLDVTDIPDVKLGSEVIVFGGRELPMELVAEWADTICYEIICTLSLILWLLDAFAKGSPFFVGGRAAST